MTRRMLIDDLTDLAVPGSPALSPDGRRIGYVLRTADREQDRNVERLWEADLGSGVVRQLTDGPADSAPAWSPDGRSLAFLRDGEQGPQLWLSDADGRAPQPVTDLPLGAGYPVWSPDGRRIAFTAWVQTQPAAAGAPIVLDRLDYQPDGAGMLGGKRRHLHLVDVESGVSRQLTDGNWHTGGIPAWSPDGSSLAFVAAMEADADLTGRSSAFVLDLAAGDPRRVGPGTGAVSAVAWTADGTALLLVATVASPSGFARLLRIDLAGGEPVELAAGLDRNVMAGAPGYPGGLPQLADGGAAVLFCARDDGCTRLYRVPVAGGAAELVLGGEGRTVSGLSVAGGVAAVALGSPSSFGEIVTVDLADASEIVRTRHGNSLAGMTLYRPQPRRFSISDGTVVSGWLIADPERTGPRPLLLDVHGGPHNAWSGGADEIHLYQQELVARGWVVLLVNPRGSDGYGEAFYTGVFGGWGEVDARDFLEPLDELVADGTADPDRLAVTGYSYGGFMTCYLTGLDDRFAAAAGGGVVSDMTSMIGTCDEGPVLAVHELGAQPWQDPARYQRMSPLSRVDRVRTPTLLLHGASDTTCPVSQAQQWHAALRAQGVPTRLVLYPGGSHLVILSGPPSHRMDYCRRVLDWVERYAAKPAEALQPAAGLSERAN